MDALYPYHYKRWKEGGTLKTYYGLKGEYKAMGKGEMRKTIRYRLATVFITALIPTWLPLTWQVQAGLQTLRLLGFIVMKKR
jgi:hypothetical protein